MKRIICVCLLVILMMAALAGCGQKDQKKVSDNGFYLDTECTITVYTDDEEKGRKIIKDAFMCRTLCRLQWSRHFCLARQMCGWCNTILPAQRWWRILSVWCLLFWLYVILAFDKLFSQVSWPGHARDWWCKRWGPRKQNPDVYK